MRAIIARPGGFSTTSSSAPRPTFWHPQAGASMARSPPAPPGRGQVRRHLLRRPSQPRPSQPTHPAQDPPANPGQLPAPAGSDGLLVLTARPCRHRDHIVNLPGQLTQVAEATGLMLYERNAALLVGLREDRLVLRPSFFQLNQVRKARTHGLPLRIIAHEDVLVFHQPTNRPS